MSNNNDNDNDELRQRLQQGKTLDATEKVFTVTPDNEPTPHGHLRKDVRLENMWHRATYIVIRHHQDHDEDDDIFLLVQRRSKLKDYCPGRLDPAPGGVLGYGESYDENAIRELEEEMGISVVLVGGCDEEEGQENKKSPESFKTDPSSASSSPRSIMRKIITFPYEDDRARCWGALYEVVYVGSMDDVKIQEEEVEDVSRISLEDAMKKCVEESDDWMPDGVHAMKLYHDHIQKSKSSVDTD